MVVFRVWPRTKLYQRCTKRDMPAQVKRFAIARQKRGDKNKEEQMISQSRLSGVEISSLPKNSPRLNNYSIQYSYEMHTIVSSD